MQRISSLAGAWYPNDAEKLRAFFAAGQEKVPLDSNKVPVPLVPSLIVVPHAGYEYSGKLAAAVFSRLRPEAYDRVIILAPSHHIHLDDVFSVAPADEVITPLGSVHFDQATHDVLAKLPHVGHIPEAHTGEHSIDIVLPLIQYFLPHCALKGLGALVCAQWAWQGSAKGRIATFAKALRAVLGDTPRTLLIVSTDFTHHGARFGYTPFTEDIEAYLRVLDQQIYAACATNDGELFEMLMQRTKATVCGRTPLHCVLAMLPEESRWDQVDYSTSGTLTGDFTHSVSYIGALVYADWTAPLQKWVCDALDEQAAKGKHLAEAPHNLPVLDAASKKALMTLARQSLEYAVQHGSVYPIDTNGLLETLPKALHEKRAAFVTLYKDGHLRGCIGELLPTRSLALAVAARAYDAALRDTRFQPVTKEELGAIHLDISVLSPPFGVASYEAIELGKHGIILQKGQDSAVFLPQVPIEQAWDLPTTLQHLSQKAGLEAMAWQAPDTVFFVFTSELVAEE